MKHRFKILSLLLFTSMSAWAAAVPAPEPEILPLLGIGVVAMVAVKFMRRKK